MPKPDRAIREVDETVLDWRGQLPLALGFVLLLMVAGILVWLTFDNRKQNELVAHTLEVQTTASQFFINVQSAETGQRGYLLALRPEYEERHKIGMASAPRTFARLVELTADNPSEQRRLQALKPVLEGRLAELRQTMDLAKRGQVEQARNIMRTGYGRTLMVDIRAGVDALIHEEEQLLSQRRARADRNGILLLAVTLAGLALVVTLAGLSFRNIRRYTAALEAQRDSLRDLNENLEDLVNERTADLTAANEEIQRYAYIVSHDLRAPLVNIMGFTSELDAGRKDIEVFKDEAIAAAPQLAKSPGVVAIETDLPESIDFIRASTQKMDRLINAILKISREGRRVLAPELVDMAALVDNAGKAVAHQLGQADVSLIVEPLPDVVSDRLALEQIFGNLIDNAIKYLKSDVPGEVRVSAAEKGATVEYLVADNGRGIDPRDHERVFDLFRRSGVQDRQGEGIGLAHVRALVRRLGGTIMVRSALGEGATFIVTLPRRLKEEGITS